MILESVTILGMHQLCNSELIPVLTIRVWSIADTGTMCQGNEDVFITEKINEL